MLKYIDALGAVACFMSKGVLSPSKFNFHTTLMYTIICLYCVTLFTIEPKVHGTVRGKLMPLKSSHARLILPGGKTQSLAFMYFSVSVLLDC